MSAPAAWLLLVLAGALEVVFALSLKASNGFSRLPATLLTLAAAAASLWLLSQVMRVIPVGVAYAVWTGLGAAGALAAAALLFGERLTPFSLLGVLLILGGVAVLRLGAASGG